MFPSITHDTDFGESHEAAIGPDERMSGPAQGRFPGGLAGGLDYVSQAHISQVGCAEAGGVFGVEGSDSLAAAGECCADTPARSVAMTEGPSEDQAAPPNSKERTLVVPRAEPAGLFSA